MAKEEIDEAQNAANEALNVLMNMILDRPNAQDIARLYVGAGLGVLKVLNDKAGLEQCIDYCNQYKEQIDNERASQS